MSVLRLLLAAGPEETTLRFKSMPPLWLLIMVILPVAAGIVWWIYRREGPTADRRTKAILATLRFAAILLMLFLLFQPYAETSVKKLVKSHLVVLLDTSASMEFVDTYSDAEKAERTRVAADLGTGRPSETARIELVKGVLTNPRIDILGRLAEKFHLNVYSFDADTALLASASEADLTEGGTGTPFADRVEGIRANGAWTMIGDALDGILEEFRLRDEPLAGIVLVSDGRQNGGSTGPIEVARRAAAAQPPVPFYVVGVGDPDLPRNIHVSNLRAREVVLRGDELSFEFTVSHKGYAGEAVTVRLDSLDEEGNRIDELDLTGAEVVLGEDDTEQLVRVSHRFNRSGSYYLRIGIPVEPGEKIENDNFLEHHVRVVDKKIKVLFVDNWPRWEYRFLKDALIRDTETVLAHVILQSADPEGVVQPFTDVPGWGPRQRFPRTREELFDYDVVIFGDVDWMKLADSREEAREILGNLKQFVEDGGGFIMIAGQYDSPKSYRNTPIEDILPVVLSRQDESVVVGDSATAFNLRLTVAGRANPVMQLDNDPRVNRRLWEEDPFTGQFWYSPVARAKTAATVLAVHPGEYNRNQFGPHPIIALMPFKKGTTLFVGVDELWRLRWSFGNRYFYRFYGEAIRLLATYKLLVGNNRFKIFTDEDVYFVGDPVEITAKVYDREFNPAIAETQVVRVKAPDGEEQEVTLALDPDDPGSYSQVVSIYQEGTYRISADPPEAGEERPERLFRVEYSTEEMKNPLLDIEALTGMAGESGGQFFPLWGAGALPDEIPPKSVYISTEVRSEDLWDELWVLLLFTGILATEWLIRKRYRLI